MKTVVYIVIMCFLLKIVTSEVTIQPMNLLGAPLSPCDRVGFHERNPALADPKYPQTGYFRDGKCTASSMDIGAHFVCSILPQAETANGKIFSPFWTQTGQAVSSEEAQSMPMPGPWCICMWAFAKMLHQDPAFIDTLSCPSTHIWTLQKYDVSQPTQAAALAAICEKCGIASEPNVDDSLKQRCAAVLANRGVSDAEAKAEL